MSAALEKTPSHVRVTDASGCTDVSLETVVNPDAENT